MAFLLSGRVIASPFTASGADGSRVAIPAVPAKLESAPPELADVRLRAEADGLVLEPSAASGSDALGRSSGAPVALVTFTVAMVALFAVLIRHTAVWSLGFLAALVIAVPIALSVWRAVGSVARRVTLRIPWAEIEVVSVEADGVRVTFQHPLAGEARVVTADWSEGLSDNGAVAHAVAQLAGLPVWEKGRLQ